MYYATGIPTRKQPQVVYFSSVSESELYGEQIAKTIHKMRERINKKFKSKHLKKIAFRYSIKFNYNQKLIDSNVWILKIFA